MDNTSKVLKACIDQALNGKLNISVFDLMYETSLAYPELKEILKELVFQKELEAVDIKTYKFTGDVTRKFEEDDEADKFEDFDEKLSYLEKKRLELIERMKNARKELFPADDEDEELDEDEEDDDEDYGYFEDEDCHLNKLIESLHLDDEDEDEE